MGKSTSELSGRAMLVSYLQAADFKVQPGLDTKKIDALERKLRCKFPKEVRTFYEKVGGLREDQWDGTLPMRPMPPSEIVETFELLTGEDMYSASKEARYLFTDDGSNWAGIFVAGPLVGKVTLLDHDSSWPLPVFRDFDSFCAALVVAQANDQSWHEMPADYPLSESADKALVKDAMPLAKHFLASAKTPDPLVSIKIALQLLPATERDTLRSVLLEPKKFVPEQNPNMVIWAALRVATVQQQTAL